MTLVTLVGVVALVPTLITNNIFQRPSRTLISIRPGSIHTSKLWPRMELIGLEVIMIESGWAWEASVKFWLDIFLIIIRVHGCRMLVTMLVAGA